MSFTILVVDNEDQPRTICCELLQDGCTAVTNVIAACSAAEALEILAVQQADMVITDLEMPGMNGEELTKKLKKEKPSLPMVIATGKTDYLPHAEFPPDFVLTKPYKAVQLLVLAYGFAALKK